MEILEKFENAGVEIPDIKEAALGRKEDLVNNARPYTMSRDSVLGYRNLAVKLGLVPERYKMAEFSEEKIKENIKKEHSLAGHKFVVRRMTDYFEVVTEIINSIQRKQLPSRSYLIGAPNGFGKQSFATDCIVYSLMNGWKTVPYISLSELAELKVANDKVLMRGLMGYEAKSEVIPFNFNAGEYDVDGTYTEYSYTVNTADDLIKRPMVLTGQYSWSEYINAPVLFCFFSGQESKVVESQILYTLLSIRSAKGFPTIVTMSTSLNLYKNDPYIGKYVWNEIQSYNPNDTSYGKVYHVSCYKDYTTQINREKRT
jgi:hypothetical protein